MEDFHYIPCTSKIPMYLQSPFYVHFNDTYTKIYGKKNHLAVEEKAKTSNKYYAPGFVLHLLNFWMPYFPWWSAVDLDMIDPLISRLSNANIESCTRVMKEKLLRGNSRSSIADVVRILAKDGKTTAGLVEMDVHIKKSKSSSKKPNYPSTVSDEGREDTASSAEKRHNNKKRKRSSNGIKYRKIVSDTEEENTAVSVVIDENNDKCTSSSENFQHSKTVPDQDRKNTAGSVSLDRNRKKTKSSSKKSTFSDDISNPDSEEAWAKKSRKSIIKAGGQKREKKTHLKASYIKRKVEKLHEAKSNEELNNESRGSDVYDVDNGSNVRGKLVQFNKNVVDDVNQNPSEKKQRKGNHPCVKDFSRRKNE